MSWWSATVERMSPATVLVLKMMFFLFYLELLHSVENKREVILQKVIVFTSML